MFDKDNKFGFISNNNESNNNIEGLDNIKTDINNIKGEVDKLNTQYKDIAKQTITNEERTKLNSLKNYDDSEIKNKLNEKANKNEIFTMANMGQDVKEAMTGGSVAVVGVDCVSGINVIDGSLKIENLSEEYWETTYNKIKIIKVECTTNDLTVSNIGDLVTIKGTTTSDSIVKIYVDKPTLVEGGYYVKFHDVVASSTLEMKIAYMDGTFSEPSYVNLENAGFTISSKPIDYIYIYIGKGKTINYSNKVFMVESEKGTWDYVYKYKRKIVLNNELNGVKNEILSKIPSTKLNGLKWSHVGDSIGAGNGATNVNWQKEVANYFGMSYVNCAIGGRTTGGMGNWSSLSPNQYDLVPSDTNIISLNGGTNDFIQNVTLEKLRTDIIINFKHYSEKNTNVKIFMVNMLNGITKVKGGALESQLTNDLGLTPYDYAKCYIDTCNEIGIPCLNLFGKCGINIYNSNKYIVDGVHPNDIGYKLVIKTYIDFINLICGYLTN